MNSYLLPGLDRSDTQVWARFQGPAGQEGPSGLYLFCEHGLHCYNAREALTRVGQGKGPGLAKVSVPLPSAMSPQLSGEGG